jgi:sugar phosphate isomerase/epimerase
MKLAMSNIAWNDEHEYYYQVLHNNGFTGLEVAPTKFVDKPYDNLAVAKQIRLQLQAYCLSVVSMQSLLFGQNGLDLFGAKESRDKLGEYLKKAIVYAETIGCKVLVFGNPKNRITSNIVTDYAIGLEFFNCLGEFAKQHNTCLCIEPNAKDYGTNFINTVDSAYQLVSNVASDGFGMIIDTGTMLLNKDEPELILMVLSKVKHIHISMPFLKPFNQDFSHYIDWFTRFISIVKTSAYNEYLSIEMANASKDDIERSIELLSKLVRE